MLSQVQMNRINYNKVIWDCQFISSSPAYLSNACCPKTMQYIRKQNIQMWYISHYSVKAEGQTQPNTSSSKS